MRAPQISTASDLQPADDPPEDELYASLCDHAHQVATAVLNDSCHGVSVSAECRSAIRYVHFECYRFVKAYAPRNGARPDGPAVEALDAVASAVNTALDDSHFYKSVFTDRPHLWHRLMSCWPMGYYATMTANALKSIEAPLGVVVELGAGVGATTRLVRPIVARRGGQLIATDLHYGHTRRVDFNLRLSEQLPTAHAVVATNALHCAADPVATLSWIGEVLRDGGALVFAEGAPYPEPGVPWALNMAFGPCHGWFDGGGFRTPNFWVSALDAAGFGEIYYEQWPSARYEFGGVFVARFRHN
jgi:SAM-dependent methyltransferase